MVLDPALLEPALPQGVLLWQHQWPPKWKVLDPQEGGIMAPDFYAPNPVGPLVYPQGPNWWEGSLAKVEHCLEWCDPILTWQELKHGQGLEDHHNNPHLHTECCTLSKCNGWLKSQGQFKLLPNGKYKDSKTSLSRGYILVKDGGFVDNTSDFLLHTLLCYAYYGPPPPSLSHPVAGHLCHHKLCICPWHLAWMEQGTNVQMWWDHVMQKDYA